VATSTPGSFVAKTLQCHKRQTTKIIFQSKIAEVLHNLFYKRSSTKKQSVITSLVQWSNLNFITLIQNLQTLPMGHAHSSSSSTSTTITQQGPKQVGSCASPATGGWKTLSTGVLNKTYPVEKEEKVGMQA